MSQREGVGNVLEREKFLEGAFDKMRGQASHSHSLERDIVRGSVKEFRENKHVFVFNGSAGKGYFLKVEDGQIFDIAPYMNKKVI